MGSILHSLLKSEDSGLSSGWAGHHSLPTLSACALRVDVSKNKVQKDFLFGILRSPEQPKPEPETFNTRYESAFERLTTSIDVSAATVSRHLSGRICNGLVGHCCI